MLVIEGADLVGKTTMARAVTRLLHERGMCHIPLHLSRPPAHFDYLQSYLQVMGRDTVWDRFHLSALIYRSLDDHPAHNLLPEHIEVVEANLRLLGGMTVVLYCDNRIICDRYKERSAIEMYALERVLSVNDAFEEMSRHTEVLVRGKSFRYRIDAAYCTTTEGPDVIAAQIVDQYAARYERFSELFRTRQDWPVTNQLV